MASDPRKRQKKLERRAAKRRDKRQLAVREKSAGMPQRMAAAAAYPVLESGATEDLWTHGLGWAWLSRQLPNGSIAVAIFLVDRYCLGVKNVIVDIVGRFTYENEYMHKMRSRSKMRPLAPAAVRKLVEGAVQYARRFGLSPHAAYGKACPIFGDIDAGASAEEFEFGKDGKPFFMAGPNDSPERCRQIMSSLALTCGGTDAFDFLMPIDPADTALGKGLALEAEDA